MIRRIKRAKDISWALVGKTDMDDWYSFLELFLIISFLSVFQANKTSIHLLQLEKWCFLRYVTVIQ